MLRQNFGKVQIKLHAMSWPEFVYFIESLDYARYEVVDHD